MRVSFKLGLCIVAGPFVFMWNRPTGVMIWQRPGGFFLREGKCWHDLTLRN
jgi:hypothetical protein